MKKAPVFFLLTSLSVLSIQSANAHHHHDVYVVETAPVPVYVHPAPVVVVKQAPTVIVQQAPVVNVIEVESEPPADIVEQIDACPGQNYVWIGGRWKWNGRWDWSRGYWTQRPQATAAWVPGHWRKSHHDHRWVWEEGSWRY